MCGVGAGEHQGGATRGAFPGLCSLSCNTVALLAPQPMPAASLCDPLTRRLRLAGRVAGSRQGARRRLHGAASTRWWWAAWLLARVCPRNRLP